MTTVSLALGELKADGFVIHRSGVHWLCEPGAFCAANQIIGYCNVSLAHGPLNQRAASPLMRETEVQIAFAPRMAGRLTLEAGASRGGYLNVLGVQVWDPETIVAHLEVADRAGDDKVAVSPLRLLALSGRRTTELADVHSGLLPGWHSRKRSWWCETGETPTTLISLGICDATGIVLGDDSAFFEMFQGAPAATQVIFIPDHPVTPCAPVLLDQFKRTPAETAAIADDLRRELTDGAGTPTADDWLFAGALIGAFGQSPLRDSADIFTPSGTKRLKAPDTALLSLSAEPQSLLRHKKLGYHLAIMRHHQAAAGPQIKKWLATAFEPVRRDLNRIRDDYVDLIETVGRELGTSFLILNRMSTSGDEDISSYAAFDTPMSDLLSNIASKELNLMLYDVADDRDVDIIDVDAVAADLGGSVHLPDGIHQSGSMQAVLRAQIIQSLDRRRTAPLVT